MEVLGKLRLINEIFWEYSRDFQYMGLLLAAVIFLYCCHKDHLRGRRMAVFVMLYVILLAFPPFVWLSELVLGEEGVYNLFWIVPSVFLISYAAVLYGSWLKKKNQKLIWIAACLLLAVLAGDTAEQGGIFFKNEHTNLYQVNEEDLEVCRILEKASEDTVVLGASLDQIMAIRRVNQDTKVVYGSDMILFQTSEEDEQSLPYDEEHVELFAYMQDDPISLELVMECSRDLGVNCIVFDKRKTYSRPVSVLVEDGEAEILGDTKNYWVVRLLV